MRQEPPNTGANEGSSSSEEKEVDGQEESNASGVDVEPEPENFLGVAIDKGKLWFLIKFKGKDEVELVRSKKANIKWPQKVIKFYEERLVFH
ncbi:Heterochromatin protein 1 [Orchesella cincta]|uniref:Heterochromatin protein 1 n=1 Tax=Orchesella cincta TaxID=48709 RepID=A0A1D2M8Y4_ORCCI|nr:Heterochromatin protein 1 [Orchesella cincta]